MKIEIDEKLGEKNKLQKWTVEIFKKVKNKLSIKDLTIEIQKTKSNHDLVDLNGISGYCPNKNYIRLRIDSTNSNFNKKNFQLCLAHEFQHAARRRAGVKIGESTFYECLISEGLADYFCETLLGETPVWVKKFKANEFKKIEKKASKIYNCKMNDRLYEQWFTKGNLTEKIPKWAGYSLGYILAKKLKNKKNEN